MDNFADEFDGVTKDFQLRIAGNITSIIAAKGSPIVVQDVLIVLYNNILQVPGEGYQFEGGSTIIFPEPPEPGDTCEILFYKGNGDVDVQDIDILETVKEGDTLQIVNDTSRGQTIYLEEDPRLVYSVDATDRVTTNAYNGPGNTSDINLERPVIWCKQSEDVVINGKRVAKIDLNTRQISSQQQISFKLLELVLQQSTLKTFALCSRRQMRMIPIFNSKKICC